jgi:aspartyl-tRNA(Asn)/glutamyl-tRNA(Gln) amidotransferase subunit A
MQTIPFNVTGNPAMSIPTGFSASDLPLAMQIVGRAFDEPTVLGIGAAFEAATKLYKRRPSFETTRTA